MQPLWAEPPHVVNYRGIHAEVIVYIFAHLHTALHTEGNV